jgi:hypothetical protein
MSALISAQNVMHSSQMKTQLSVAPRRRREQPPSNRLCTSCCDLRQKEQANCSGAAIRCVWQASSTSGRLETSRGGIADVSSFTAPGVSAPTDVCKALPASCNRRTSVSSADSLAGSVFQSARPSWRATISRHCDSHRDNPSSVCSAATWPRVMSPSVGKDSFWTMLVSTTLRSLSA